MIIKTKDIRIGMWVKVKRDVNPKADKGAENTTHLQSDTGIVTFIPPHRKFCTVQFFNKKGKALYKESFFWQDILQVIVNKHQ